MVLPAGRAALEMRGHAGDAGVGVRTGELVAAGVLTNDWTRDIALRDFGLLLSALTLSRLASADFGQAVQRR